MTAFDYAVTAATATRLLARFGAACSLLRTAAGAYDPATGLSTETTTTLATYAAVFDYPARYIDGSLILAGDKQALMDPDQEPKQGDRLTWNSLVYTVVAVKEIAPAGTPVLYECQVRG